MKDVKVKVSFNIRDEIIRELEQNPNSEEQIVKKLMKIYSESRYKNSICTQFINILSGIEMNDDDAKIHYEKIIEHRNEMEMALGRKVDFRVGMFDYFSSRKPKLQNPKLIELKEYEYKNNLIMIDELTGLYNRRFLFDYLDKEYNRSSRKNLNFSIAFLDIDDFKKVNDTYGHRVGDKVLKEFSEILKEVVRLEDIPARFGGEEFVLAMPDTDLDNAKLVTKRFMNKVRKNVFTENINLTFSAGIACYPLHGKKIEEIIEKADQALYYSKKDGKNKISIIDTKVEILEKVV
jgi:diguanylate cyclase (GGDEF)-like protein